jgi:hypothetical protein
MVSRKFTANISELIFTMGLKDARVDILTSCASVRNDDFRKPRAAHNS